MQRCPGDCVWGGSRNLGSGQTASVLDGPGVFAPDILGGQLDIEHGGVNLGMTHQVHERGQGDSRTHHVSSKGVGETMGVGLWDLTAQTMVTEQRAEPGRSHGLSAAAVVRKNLVGNMLEHLVNVVTCDPEPSCPRRRFCSPLCGTALLLPRACCSISVAFSLSASGRTAQLQPRICSSVSSW